MKTMMGELRKMLRTKKWRKATIAKLSDELDRRGVPPGSLAYLRRARQHVNVTEHFGDLPDLRRRRAA